LEEVDDSEALKRAFNKKNQNLDLTNKKDRDKIIASLISRGFSFSAIKKEIENA
jgi:regulatory protein